jgi:hypothetical protein
MDAKLKLESRFSPSRYGNVAALAMSACAAKAEIFCSMRTVPVMTQPSH